jgi:hypothetical protein
MEARGAAEVGRVVRVERHESRRGENEGQRGLRVLPLRSPHREKPDRFLVVEDIRDEEFPGNRPTVIGGRLTVERRRGGRLLRLPQPNVQGQRGKKSKTGKKATP